MNWRQLQAILILRWQLSRNQWRRAGTFNAVLTTIASALMLVVGITGFFAALIGGSFLLPRAEPLQILILWDVLIVGFLFFWLVGLMTELQRSELLSLEKLLHLPLSLSGAFLLNYLSSWFSLSLGVFLPVLAGLCLAFLLTHGVRALLLWPLSIGFVVMITSVTYQLRGWLAQLMQNKRRRGTILTAITMAFLLLMQVPNIINMTVLRQSQRTIHRNHQEEVRQIMQLTQELQNQQITLEEYNRRRLEIQNQQSRGRGIGFRPDSEELVFWLKLANLIVPIGWLPYGASALMEGRSVYAVLCSAGMMAIGAGSLWRSYRSTLRAETASVGSVSRVAKRESDQRVVARPLLIARRIPGVSDQVAAIAWGSFCQLLRAPEAKMMLLPPLMLLCIFGSSFYFMADSSFPRQASTVVMFSGIGATLLSITQFLCNSFGFDRQGFRAYLLMPVERRDLLLGKNLGLLPLVFALYGVVIVLTVLTLPVRPFQIPTALIQMLNAYLLMAPTANLVAIRFPVTVPIAGSLRPQQVQWAPLLMQFAMMLVISVALLPAALAWGGEFLAESLTDVTWVPWSLLVSLVETGLIGLIYFHALEEEGRYLQRRETLILEVVAAAHE